LKIKESHGVAELLRYTRQQPALKEYLAAVVVVNAQNGKENQNKEYWREVAVVSELVEEKNNAIDIVLVLYRILRRSTTDHRTF